jgi:hypothetical protein
MWNPQPDDHVSTNRGQSAQCITEHWPETDEGKRRSRLNAVRHGRRCSLSANPRQLGFRCIQSFRISFAAGCLSDAASSGADLQLFTVNHATGSSIIRSATQSDMQSRVRLRPCGLVPQACRRCYEGESLLFLLSNLVDGQLLCLKSPQRSII